MPVSTQKKPTRRELQKEETRRLILDSAYALIQEQGYDRTTMRQLASHCGVGLGTLFKHFPDKPSILVAAFQGDIGAVLDKAFKTIPAKDLYKQLRHILSEIYGYYATNQIFSRVLVKESLFLTGEAGEAIHAQTMAFLEKIGSLFMQAAQRKEIAPVQDSLQTTVSFFSFYLLGLTAGLRSAEFDVKAQADMVINLTQACHSVLKKESPRSR